MSSSDEATASKIPDESVEGLMSSEIVNDDQIDFSNYIEGISTLEDDDDDDDEDDVVDETLELQDDDDVEEDAIDGTFKNSVLYSPKENASLNRILPARIVDERRSDEIVNGASPSATDVVTTERLAAIDINDDGNAREEEDDEADLSSIFNVSREDLNETDDGKENDEENEEAEATDLNDVTDDGNDETNASNDSVIESRDEMEKMNEETDHFETNHTDRSFVGRNTKRKSSSSNHYYDEDDSDIVGPVLGEVSLHDVDDGGDWDRELGSSNKKLRLEKASCSSSSPPLPSRPPPSIPNFADDGDNALHQFPSSYSKNPGPSNPGLSDCDSASNSAHAPNSVDHPKHLPSETDENTPPSLWGISEVISRLQQQQRENDEDDAFLGSVGVGKADEDAFAAATSGDNSAEEDVDDVVEDTVVDVFTSETKDENQENTDPSSAVCSANCSTKSNGNVLQGKSS